MTIPRSRVPAASSLLRAMGNPHRLAVLCDLSAGELSVGQLESRVGLSQSALSQHLARLRAERLVRTRRERQTIYYTLDSAAVGAVLVALETMFGEQRPARSVELVNGDWAESD